MELKTPTKKGIKTPRDRPPLPMLNESSSGWCVDEYDWPLFTGYYNGTSVIVDDPQAMTLLTNKGFFGKGSLSRGCPNLSKRIIPNNVVYESQWKRRKMWMESLSTLLENEKKTSQAIDNKGSTDIEKMEVENEKNDSQQNTSKTDENEGNECCQNKINETKKANTTDIGEKNIDGENKNPTQSNSYKTEEELSRTGDEVKEKNKNVTSQDNIINIDDEKSNDVEIIEVDNEKISSLEKNSCKNEEKVSRTNVNEENKNESAQDKIINIDDEKSNDLGIMEVDNEKNSSLQDNSSITEENPSNKTGSEESKNETSQDDTIKVDNEKNYDVELVVVDREKNISLQKSSCKTEKPSRTNGNQDKEENKNVTSRGVIINIEDEKSNDVEIIEVDDEKISSLQKNSCKNEEKVSRTNGNEESKNETAQDKIINIDNEKSNDLEKMEVDNEKISSLQKNSCKNEEKVSRTNGNEESQNETAQDKIINIEDEKSNDLEIMEVDNEKNSSLQDNSSITEENPSSKIGSEDSKNETSQYDNNINVDNEKNYDVELMVVDNEKSSSLKNNLCVTKQKPSRTNSNGSDELNKINCNEASLENKADIDNKKIHSYKLAEESSKTSGNEDVDIKQITKESKGQSETRESNKNEEISNITHEDTQNEKKSKDDERIDANDKTTEESNKSKVICNQSKRVKKIRSSKSFVYSLQKGILNVNEVLVIPDIEGGFDKYFTNLKPYIEEEKVKTAVEVLYLSLEEAFFLSYFCNCLQILDLTSNILQFKDMWVLFQESQPDFIEKYVAYHYFRAKGWVVKSGTKFGGDFLLYKKGPLYFHASYIVIVEVLKNDENSRNKITWQKVVGMNRMAESANKEILICHVLWPDVEEKEFENPGILKEFTVSETLLRRWQPTQEKTPEIK